MPANHQLEALVDAVRERLAALAKRVAGLDPEVVRRDAYLQRKADQLQDLMTMTTRALQSATAACIAELEQLRQKRNKNTAG